MTNEQYLATTIALMEKLETTFAKGFRIILNAIFRAAAEQVMHGNIRSAEIVVNKFIRREREYLEARYIRTANVFGAFAQNQMEDKQVSFDQKAKLSPDYWNVMRNWTTRVAPIRNSLIDIGTKSIITKIIRKGIAEGKGQAGIAKDLRTIGGISNRVRANTIARTETHSAANQSTRAMADNLGAKEKQWMDAGDARVRSDHKHVEGGRWIPTTDNFNVGGEMLEYPGDPYGSAGNVINCRCTVLYRRQGA